VLYLDRSSLEPAYRQLVELVVFLVRTGKAADGMRLPGVRVLAASLGVHRNTTAHAYGELARRGYVSRTPGTSGLTVRRARGAPLSADADLAAAGLLGPPARECISLGLTPMEIRRVTLDVCRRATSSQKP
jgi:GntR family transcriptional regulator/MocR family aminotransferase